MSGDAPGKKKLAAILPAPGHDPGLDGESGSHSRTSELPPKRQKRAGTGRFACDSCRSRKSACNGVQPCSACTRRKTLCVFTAAVENSISTGEKAELELLRKENNDLRGQLEERDIDTLEGLRTLPHDEALLLFYQMRAAALSEHANSITTRDIPSPAKESLEFELMMRHPIAYPVVSSWAGPDVAPHSKEQHDPGGVSDPLLPRSSLESIEPPFSPVEHRSPQHSALLPEDLCDPRLGQFEVYHWLQSPVSTDFAARAISFYLTTDHPILGLFDADLFLDDLVAQRTEFCCPLLLSAVLSFACQGFGFLDREVAGLSHFFFAEAERLYNEEKTGDPQFEPAIMTVAATQLLSVTAACHGKEEVAHKYLQDGIQLACKNGLLAVGKGDSARNWLDGHLSNVKAASHTAWGTFCRATLHGMNYQNSYVDIPPWLPIPGTSIERAAGSDAVPFNLPSYMGHSFTELCRLAPIINEMLRHYYDNGDRVAPTPRTSFESAETMYSELLQWAHSLPVAMHRGVDMPHHVAIIHIQLHAAILDLFRPFLHSAPGRSSKLGQFSADDRTPAHVYLASVNQLKHLLLAFRTRYPCATTSMSWHNALLYVANACLPSRPGQARDKYVGGRGMGGTGGTGGMADDPHGRAWFLACIDSYRALAPQFNIVNDIIRGLLAMAVQKSLLSIAEGRAFMDGVRGEPLSRHTRQLSEPRQGEGSQRTDYPGSPDLEHVLELEPRRGSNAFVVDLNTAAAASVKALTWTFEEMAMFDEFTTGEESIEQT